MSEQKKPMEPKRSAAGILMTGEGSHEVLLGRRSDKLRFMGGHWSFPGGRVGEGEGAARVINAPDDDTAECVHAVTREIFEETGVLPVEGKLPPGDTLRTARREIIDEESRFDTFMERHGLRIDAARFIDAGTWITPKGSPIRFHARYFLIRHDRNEQSGELIEGELSALEWMEPGAARRRWREGSILLPPPVAYALQQIAEFPYPRCLEPLRRTTHIVPDTPGRIEYRCGINLIPLRTPTIPPATHTNCIAVGEKELYLIDPAATDPAEQEKLRAQIDHLAEVGARVRAVLLTHSHPDHVGAAEFTRARYGAEIWAHEETARRVGFGVDRRLRHDEVIPVPGDPEWRLRCLHTPGHDPGHLVFLEETGGTLIAGDMIANGSTIVVSPDHGGDMTQYLDSLELLLRAEYDFMIPAHGFPLDDPKSRIRQYIDHRLAREAKIKAVLDSGETGFRAILERAYDDTPKQAWPLAEHSLRAHMIRLGVTPER